MTHQFKLTEFIVLDKEYEDDENECNTNEGWSKKKSKRFLSVQMFGLNEKGETCSISVDDFQPFFYAKIPNSWKKGHIEAFIIKLKNYMGSYYEDSLIKYKKVKNKKLYGFDGGEKHSFILLKFKSLAAFRKATKMWYTGDSYENKRIIEGGISIEMNKQKYKIQIYESNIPPLLRLFHLSEISPSGWIEIPDTEIQDDQKETSCDYEFDIPFKKIKSIPEKETPVPYKICSYDIEASSSHGDFPLPIKNYRKLAYAIVNILCLYENINIENIKLILKFAIFNAFNYKNINKLSEKQIYDNNLLQYLNAAENKEIIEDFKNIELVYPIIKPDLKVINEKFNEWINLPLKDVDTNNDNNELIKMFQYEDDDNNENYNVTKKIKKIVGNVTDLLLSKKHNRESKIEILTNSLTAIFPKLEGDRVTFIGSTFIRHGETKPYLNHCIVLNTCKNIPNVENSVIETYKTEKEVLLAWTNLIQRENPDIMIGYNIHGFDDKFMFLRAKENHCVHDFLQLGRILDEPCFEKDFNSDKIKIKESSIVIASGQHDLHYIDMRGRLQIDLYNYFRRSANLESYKLDYVCGNYLGDKVTNINYNKNTTILFSKNLAGIYSGSYIHLEETNYSTEYYKNGDKFEVLDVNYENKSLTIKGIEKPDMSKKVRWCLAKDDVTPQDIFRLSNGNDADRAIVAKYCIQDCNLVHELFIKIDIMTEFIEMAKLCSVPISFLVFRGQGIKLTSFISKKCREKNTLMPVINKSTSNEGYEGAIVLPPKCNLYLEDPVACVDYSSLYPSSMFSENICHSSKVWTKEYDLDENLIKETGIKDCDGNYVYTNLEGYKYVEIEYDTYKYERPNPTAAAKKIKTGKKICCFAEGKEKAIMPSVLDELLSARKATKKLMKNEADPFMKNILDKRQLSIKLTANSLYGQCGAKTSSFYEKDVAASTTATGRKLLTYAKRIIEEVYGDKICKTKKYGDVKSKAKYIYGDTDSVFFCFFLENLNGDKIKGKKALEITIELAQEAGEIATKFLKKPHDLEYEKTFLPFCLLSKKRYVGMLYELDPNKCYRKSMGIVLKRRDNAPIVKDVYGGIIDILMKEQNINSAISFLRQCLKDIVNKNIPIEKLIITKSLRSNYKNPQQIAHNVLAIRMGKRDPGNKPGNGDRIPFAYILNSNKKALQGDKIEHPSFIKNNNLSLDYGYYITNQIMKPVLQVFALVLEEMPGFKEKLLKKRRFEKQILQYKKDLSQEKFIKKQEQLRNKEVQKLLFDNYINTCNLSKDNLQSIKNYFK